MPAAIVGGIGTRSNQLGAQTTDLRPPYDGAPSLVLEKEIPIRSSIADGDGDIDLLLHIRTRDTSLACGDTEATLQGETSSGERITGTSAVTTVGCK